MADSESCCEPMETEMETEATEEKDDDMDHCNDEMEGQETAADHLASDEGCSKGREMASQQRERDDKVPPGSPGSHRRYPVKEHPDPPLSEGSDETANEKGRSKSEDESDTSSDERESFCNFFKFGKGPQLRLPPKPSSWSSRDTARYREGYPGKKDDLRENTNHLFYTNQIPFRPNGCRINDFHLSMWGNYQELEWNHSYIQWLFPIRERGMNWHSQELQLHEVKAILSDEEARRRLMTSYELMLDFYGMKIQKDSKIGELERTDNYKERFYNLNRSHHNYLRITRILKCLGEFDMEQFKAPFIRFILHEAIETRELHNVLDSCMSYWVEVLKDDRERNQMWELARKMVKKANKQLGREKKKKNGSHVNDTAPSVTHEKDGCHGEVSEKGVDKGGDGASSEVDDSGDKGVGGDKDSGDKGAGGDRDGASGNTGGDQDSGDSGDKGARGDKDPGDKGDGGDGAPGVFDTGDNLALKGVVPGDKTVITSDLSDKGADKKCDGAEPSTVQ